MVTGDFCSARYVMDIVLHHEDPNNNFNTRIKWFAPRIRGRVIDVGCNSGGLSMWLSQFTNDEYYACDIRPEIIDEAIKQQNNIKEGKLDGWCHPPSFAPKVIFYVMDALNLTFPDNMFNTCVAGDVIEHLSPFMIQAFVEETYRVLKRTGKLLMTTATGYLVDPKTPGHPFEYEQELHHIISHTFSITEWEKVWADGTETLYIEAIK